MMAEESSILEHIRKRPGMYIGGLDAQGLVHMVIEMFDNALDLHLAGKCKTIWIDTGPTFSVCDDGPGVPEAVVLTALTEPHYSNSFDAHAPHVHVSGFGGGLAIVNALSRTLSVETCVGESRRRWRFVDQHLVEESWHPRGAERWTTRIRCRPDDRIFPKTTVDRALLVNTIAHVPSLCPGLCIEVDAQRFEQPEGLIGWVRAQGGAEVERRVLEQPGTRVEAAWGWAERPISAGYVNYRPSPRGTHVQGLEQGIARRIKEPVATVREQLVGIIHVITNEPKFAAPTREQFADKVIGRFIARGVARHVPAAQESRALP